MRMQDNRVSRATGTTLGVVATLVTALGLPAASLAQEIGEIVVTARRVQEKLKDVPLAITAFDSAAIESAGINNLNDVAALTPGLSFFNPLGENLPVPVIRGVVPQDIFGENAAAIFIDGVYVSGREGLNFSQLDVDRIEVLKGPQSAMYGRNAFSGAINYVTKPPSDVFETKGEAEGGNRGKQRGTVSVSGPIFSDTLTGRVAYLYDEWDGSYDNTLNGGDDIGGYRFRTTDGRLRWRPRDNLDINFGIYYSNDEIDEAAAGGLPVNCEDQVEQTSADAAEGPLPRLQNWCGKIPKLADLPDALDPSQFPNMVTVPYSVTDDSMPKNARALGEDRNLTRGNLNIAWDLDIGTFSFLTGYTYTDQKSISDFERSAGDSIPLVYCPDASGQGSGLPVCDPPYSWARTPMGFVDQENGTTNEEWSQEIRFTSPQDQRLRYSTGFYYFHLEQNNRFGELLATRPLPESIFDIGVGPVAYPTALAIGSFIFGPSLTGGGPLDPGNRLESQEKTKSWSVFGSIDYDLTDAWQLRLEARLSEEAQSQYNYDYMRCGDPDTLDTFPFNNPPVADCGDDYYDLRVPGPTITDQGSTRFETVTGRVGLKYKFDSGWMAYGSIARGKKPGGLQLARVDTIDATGLGEELIAQPFDPETLTAYEVGIKGYSEDRRISLDMSFFYNDWTDIVLRQLTDISPASGKQFDQPIGLNFNAGDAKVWGWEMSTDLGFTDNLTGRFTVGYTDSTLTNARMDTFALFPSFYSTDPSCAPSAIQAITGVDADATEAAQNAKATECRKVSGDVSGNTQMRQPEWTQSASLTYRRQLMGDWEWFARADENYLSKIFIGNDNQGYLPSRMNVNLRLGVDSPRYSLEFWVRNLLENDDPIAAFRDIYWTNDSDIQGKENPATIRDMSTFDDFPPLRLSVTYPSLRTYGLIGKVRFGGAEK